VPITTVGKFRYLGSIIEKKGDINDDINHRIGARWQKWRNASRVLCDKKILASLKGRVYRMVVRSILLYGADCWPLNKTQIQRLMVAEMRMILWMCEFTRLDRIKNEVIRKKVRVAPIEEKWRETRLKWFVHVKRRGVNAPVRRHGAINLIHCRRGH